MTPALQREKLRLRESLSNLPKVRLQQVAETNFKCNFETESSVHNPKSSATMISQKSFLSFFTFQCRKLEDSSCTMTG